MPQSDPLVSKYPKLAARLARLELADLPTPVRQCSLELGSSTYPIHIKEDNLTSGLYGGNKIRKLEYLLARARQRGRRRIATFGAVSSNHALATALFARANDLLPVCFLMHQTATPLAAAALAVHLDIGTEIVEFGGTRRQRIAILRRHLRGRDTDIIPLGGSSWIGTVGFVAAGLELATQIEAGHLPVPARIYVASGTLGTAAGLGLGLAAAGLSSAVHAVRVSHHEIAYEAALLRLIEKTAAILGRLDPSFPADIATKAARTNVVLRHGFFEPGYARSNPATDAAIALARDQADLVLEPTYTGKAMAAMLDDLRAGAANGELLFWNTYNSAPLPVRTDRPRNPSALPDAFLGYLG